MDPISSPSAEVLRKKAADIIAGRDYAIDVERPDNSWILVLLLEIIDWILIPFLWLFALTEGLPSFLRWTIVIGLAVVLVLLIVHIVYTLATALRTPKRVIRLDPHSRRPVIEPEELERLAYEASLNSEYTTAIRFLFRAGVLRLERLEKKPNRPGTTNRELLRRYRDRPPLGEPLGQLVETIDRKWYGDEDCSDVEYTTCQAAHSDLCRAIGERLHAVSA